MVMSVLIIYRTGQILSGPEQSWSTPAVTHEALTTAMEPMRVWWPPGHVGLVTPEVRLKSTSGWSVNLSMSWWVWSAEILAHLPPLTVRVHPTQHPILLSPTAKTGLRLSVSLFRFLHTPVPILIGPASSILIPMTKSSKNFVLCLCKIR